MHNTKKVYISKNFLSLLICIAIPLVYITFTAFYNINSGISIDKKYFIISIALDFILASALCHICYKTVRGIKNKRRFALTCFNFIILISNNALCFCKFETFMLLRFLLFAMIFISFTKCKHISLALWLAVLTGANTVFLISKYNEHYTVWFIVLATFVICAVKILKSGNVLGKTKKLYCKYKKIIFTAIAILINIAIYGLLFKILHIWNLISTIIACAISLIALYGLKKARPSAIDIIPDSPVSFLKMSVFILIADTAVMWLYVDVLFSDFLQSKIFSAIITFLLTSVAVKMKKIGLAELIKQAKQSFVQFKKDLSEFKKTKDSRIIFVFCAVFPFFLTDFILRYVINFIVINDVKYYIVPILFDIFWIFGIFYFCYAVLPQKLGKLLYAVIYLLFGILFFVNYIYFCIFNQYMWIRAILLAGEGMDYVSEALPYINGRVISVILIYISFLVITLILWKKPVYKNKYERYLKYIKCIIPFLLVAALHAGILIDTKIQIKNGAWEVWERPVLVYKNFTDANKSLNMCGFYQFTFKSIYRTMFETQQYTKEEIKECDDYFVEKKNVHQNEMTGILKGKNVVFVLMESMDDWLITEEYTPTIKYMMDNGINFENHYMPNMGSGYTFNSEFSMNTGFHCPSTTSSSSVFTSNNFDYAMPSLFAKEGYNVNSFHFNSKNFYNRKSMHLKFGYSNYYCLMDYMPIEKCVLDSEVPLNDTVYNYMTEGTFFDFFISYSAHLPYDVVDNRIGGALEKYPELVDESLDSETQVINILAHDTDEFFRTLIERLKEDGLYENTVIIGIADHYAYGYKDKEKLAEFSKEAGSEISEKVPFFIYSPGIEPVSVTKVTGAIDIVPTITNLFGLNNGYYLGNDAFNPEYPGYVYFSNGSWFDGQIHYKPGTDISSYGAENKEYIDEMNKKIIHLMEINDRVVNVDYFKNVFE